MRRRQRARLSRRHVGVQESHEDPRDYRERRRDSTQRVESHRRERGLPAGATQTRLSSDPPEAPALAESHHRQQRVRDAVEHLGAVPGGPARAVGDGRREHAPEPGSLEAQDDLDGQRRRAEEPALGEAGARHRGRRPLQQVEPAGPARAQAARARGGAREPGPRGDVREHGEPAEQSDGVAQVHVQQPAAEVRAEDGQRRRVPARRVRDAASAARSAVGQQRPVAAHRKLPEHAAAEVGVAVEQPGQHRQHPLGHIARPRPAARARRARRQAAACARRAQEERTGPAPEQPHHAGDAGGGDARRDRRRPVRERVPLRIALGRQHAAVGAQGAGQSVEHGRAQSDPARVSQQRVQSRSPIGRLDAQLQPAVREHLRERDAAYRGHVPRQFGARTGRTDQLQHQVLGDAPDSAF